MSAYTHRGVVYFATCDKYVKVGYSAAARLQDRLKHIPRGVTCPDDLDASRPVRLLHTIPGCIMRDERRIHGLFAAHHAVGEWFHLTPSFLSQLAALEYVTDAEILLRFRRARADLKRTRTRPALPRAA